MLGLAGVPAALQFIGMFFLPESPRWLMRQDKEEQAINILMKVRLKKQYR
jgi:hypothetical protein